MAVTASAVGYALAIGKTPREAVKVGLAVGSGQLAIGWQNDWIDAERDTAAARHDKPIATGDVRRESAGAAAMLAGLGTVVASFANGRRSGLAHLLAVASAASYNMRLKSTLASFAPYALSFSLLPEVVHLSGDQPEHAPAWASAGAGALGVAAHLLNVLPDREIDLAQGVRGLPQRLNRRVDITLAASCLAFSSFVISFGPRRGGMRALATFGASLLFATAAVIEAERHDSKSAFRLVLLAALFDVASLLHGARLSRATGQDGAARDDSPSHRLMR